VIFFANKGDAERWRVALLTGGYEEGEIAILSSDDRGLPSINSNTAQGPEV
jgi:hypothetical protein